MPGNGNSEKKEEKKKKLMFKFDDRASETFKNLFSGEKKFEKNFTFSSKKKFDFHQRKGKVNMRSSGSSSSNIRISSSDGNSMNAASDNGNLGKGELKFDCDDKSLEIQGKVPAYAKAKVVPANDMIGCKHTCSTLYVEAKAGPTYPNAVTGAPVPGGAVAFSPFSEVGVKIDKAYVVEDGDLLVKSTKCGSKKLVVVGDKIKIEHKFESLDNMSMLSQSQVVAQGVFSPIGATVLTPLLPTFMTSESKPSSAKPQAPAPPAACLPEPMPIPLPGGALDPKTKAFMLQDAIASDKVEVDGAVTKDGASTTVYCEDKPIALVGNNNICVNDSMKKEKCLKIDSNA